MGKSVLSSQACQQLRKIVGDNLRLDEPMSRHTTLRIGGPADAWVTPTSLGQLQSLVQYCVAHSLPITAVGGGSNLLVLDGGIRGVVIGTRALRGIERVGDTGIWVESGLSTGKLLASATKWNLGGVEFLGGVPGSVGGGLIMNAGTYLGEFKDVTREVVSVALTDGEVVRRTNAECKFVYRGSDLPPNEIVVESHLELFARPEDDIREDVKALRLRRKQREPHKVSNAGSIFKNPKDDYAGRLIEATGLKGTRIGNAECSPVHANWLVNVGSASAADMVALIEVVRDRVKKTHGIQLELEVRLLGEP